MMFYNSPLHIEFTDEGLVVEGKKREYTVRMLSELTEVLMDSTPFKENKPIYLMYRKVFSSNNIRFDITVIASRLLGKEFARTYGHYHPIAEASLTYPEIYQVLFGKAVFILQKKNKDESTDVVVIEAKEKEVVIIPPNYGHVSVNPNTEEPLFLSNLVSENFDSSYEEYKKNHGPALYYTSDGLMQNTNYVIRNTEKLSAKEHNKKYNFVCNDVLGEFYKGPEEFNFLNKPSLFFR